jgi:hypothetical protein
VNKVTSKQPANPDPSATISFQQPFQDVSEFDAYVRQAVRTMIQQAIYLEVQQFPDAHAGHVDAQGGRYVIRKGHLPERQFLVAARPVQVRQFRVRDTSPDRDDPLLYLKGICTCDFPMTQYVT